MPVGVGGPHWLCSQCGTLRHAKAGPALLPMASPCSWVAWEQAPGAGGMEGTACQARICFMAIGAVLRAWPRVSMA